MILQALNQLYDRLAPDVDYDLPRPGTSVQDITFEIVLKSDGSLIDIQDARAGTKAKRVQVPGEGKASGKITRASAPKKAGILWNDLSFMTGIEISDPPQVNRMKFDAFRDNHLQIENQIADPAFSAVCEFLRQWDPESELQRAEKCKVFAKTGFGVFRIADGTNKHVHQLPKVEAHLYSKPQQALLKSAAATQCLISGDFFQNSEIANTHQPKIKGVGKNRTLLVSFNDPAYCSLGKEQSYNAPVSKKATFQYCNALNALLSGPQSHRHRIVIGDVTTVFWTERETTTEKAFAAFFSGQTEAREGCDGTITQDPVLHQRLEAFLKLVRRGSTTNFDELDDDPNTKFFILGLSGNVTRLEVRFWHVSKLRDMLERLRCHFDCLNIQRSFDNEPEFPSAVRLLDQTARERKAISPLLGGQLMQSILNSTPYPMTLYQGVLNRIRVVEKDQNGKTRPNVNYLRASILKAVLTRNFNHIITMSLDPDCTKHAYLLGRLFATLEKTQQDALGNVNAGLRDRFYSSASATPASVFPRILRTYQHHLAKLSGGMKVNRERLVQSIHAPLDPSVGYPAHLNLEQQGLFAIGYYHQRQALFPSKSNDSEPTDPIEP